MLIANPNEWVSVSYGQSASTDKKQMAKYSQMMLLHSGDYRMSDVDVAPHEKMSDTGSAKHS